jgi:hypothetical protein
MIIIYNYPLALHNNNLRNEFSQQLFDPGNAGRDGCTTETAIAES